MDEDGDDAVFDQFVYCRRVAALTEPLQETDLLLEGTDFARFNAGANELSHEYARKFIGMLLAARSLDSDVERRLYRLRSGLDTDTDADLDTVANDRTGPETTSTTSADTGATPAPDVAAGDGEDSRLDRPSTEDTTGYDRVRSGDRAPEASQTFKRTMRELYNDICLLSEFQGSPFLSVAHVIPRSEDESLVEHPDNVMVLCRDPHRAFDAHLFTFDTDLRLHVAPSFDPAEEFFQRTLLARDGEQIAFPNGTSIDPSFLERRNAAIDWWPPADG